MDLQRVRARIQQHNRFVGYGLGSGFGVRCHHTVLFLLQHTIVPGLHQCRHSARHHWRDGAGPAERERWLKDFAAKAYQKAVSEHGENSDFEVPETGPMTATDRHRFATEELKDIVGRIWKRVLIGVGLGAASLWFFADV
jgi:hypothetical protein